MLRLKPQDVVLALKLANPATPRSYVELGEAVRLSSAEAFQGVKRLELCRLYSRSLGRVLRPQLLDLLVHGLPYVFPARVGRRAKGVPTAGSVEPLRDVLVTSS